MSTNVLPRMQELVVRRFGSRAQELGPDDDLFETLGIDSLQAADLLTDLEGEFDVEIPDVEFHRLATLGGLATVLEELL